VRFTRTALATFSALATLLAPAVVAHAAPAAAGRIAGPGETIIMPVRDALEALPVQDESRSGYERSKFRHWIDADRDGCNTRVICTLRSG